MGNMPALYSSPPLKYTLCFDELPTAEDSCGLSRTTVAQ
jgi:hypothetical protein